MENLSIKVRPDKECGGFIACTENEPIVRATGATVKEAMENLIYDLEEIERIKDTRTN